MSIDGSAELSSADLNLDKPLNRGALRQQRRSERGRLHLKPQYQPPSIPKETSMPEPINHDLRLNELAGKWSLVDRLKNNWLSKAFASWKDHISPVGKDKKSYAIGAAIGAGTAIVAAESFASGGIAPIARAALVSGVLHASGRAFDKLHKQYLKATLRGTDQEFRSGYLAAGADWKQLRSEIISFEKNLVQRKLTREQIRAEYASEEFRNMLLKYISPSAASWTELGDQTKLAENLVHKLSILGEKYKAVDGCAKSLASGLAAGSLAVTLGEAGTRALLSVSSGSEIATLSSEQTNLQPIDNSPEPTPQTEIPSSPDTTDHLHEPDNPPIETSEPTNKVVNTINVILNSHPDWYQEVTVQTGDTAGKLLNLDWTNADANIMGANIAANWDELNQSWQQIAQHSPNLLSQTEFPIKLFELQDLVDKASAGDQEALKKLQEALHWLRATNPDDGLPVNLKIINSENSLKIMDVVKSAVQLAKAA